MWDLLLGGCADILNPHVLGMMLVGTVFGIIGGATPGISGAMTLALFLPLSFGFNSVTSLALMISLYVGSMSGGLISAVLLKIPGTPAAMATTFDGAPMAEKGEAGRALGIGIVFSFIGGIISIVLLSIMAPLLAKVTLQFSYYEYFAVGIFALTIISAVGSGSMLKSLIGAVIGFFISFVGVGSISPFPRYTFGLKDLRGGFNILTVMIGFYAVSQLLNAGNRELGTDQGKVLKFRMKGFGFSLKEMKEQTGNAILSALIGVGIGILPGLGGSVSNLAAYAAVKKKSHYPEKFGTGIIDGIVASETSNNATVGGAMIPLMTLGIPGDNTTAILLAAFMIHGITPGPLLFEKEARLVYSVFAAALLAHFFMLVVEYFGIRIFVRILTIKSYILLPVVAALCGVGAYTVNNRIFDVWCMIGFGLLGFALEKLGFSLATVILGMILGPIIELNYCRGMQRSLGNFVPFLTSPISGTILAATAIIVIAACIRAVRQRQTA
ncbi:tripartite tricarboxylate transporter permease [Clostridium sp. AM58-1XD]|uniref:tripartite tricarboxylate transporter permease n=1 Tax=Clostridium sp. AM58-1XD TaxID=2292307 RepID=UPI000E4BE685|nr:tripartite tricarboxylate transporter permease [Clostridium sp. AM58-1XD]RGY98420.1 Tat pathway signal protein [Clostridium sp. AM58-1XD]